MMIMLLGVVDVVLLLPPLLSLTAFTVSTGDNEISILSFSQSHGLLAVMKQECECEDTLTITHCVCLRICLLESVRSF